ncbi:MAG TPA: secondary thiamine-phosphate synthase enzyme YjbQ [Spirochaetota bacterium]|nr:secondary thiamine-phosphate synthase enzyme YjbQ [Spirochaetota bacterium]
MIDEITVNSTAREELINIDRDIAGFIKRSEIKDGAITIFVPHTTAAVTINENADPSVARDIIKGLATVIPRNGGYSHIEGNSDAHIKASLIGHSERLIVSGGRPLLGTWQSVYFCEFDGPRTRRMILQIQ